jgi:hypothetical protein
MCVYLYSELQVGAGIEMASDQSFYGVDVPPPPPLSRREENPNIPQLDGGFAHMPKEQVYKERISKVCKNATDMRNLFDITVAASTFQNNMPLLDFLYYKPDGWDHYNVVVMGFSEQVDVDLFYKKIHEEQQHVLSARINPDTKNIVIEVDVADSHRRTISKMRGGDPDSMVSGLSAMDLCNKKHGTELKSRALLCSNNEADAELLMQVGLMCYFLQEVKPMLVIEFRQNKSGSLYVMKVAGLSMPVDLAFVHHTFFGSKFAGRVSKVSMNPVSSTMVINVRPSFTRNRSCTQNRREKELRIGKLLSIENSHKAVEKRKHRRSRHSKKPYHRRIYR